MTDLVFADDTAASRYTLHRADQLVSVLDYPLCADSVIP